MEFTLNELQVDGQAISLTYAESFPAEGDPCYWASLWPSAIALAEVILEGDDLQGNQVLELGCGCGLAGIAAGFCGAEVTVTDIMPEALELAAQNWKHNQLQPAAMEILDWCQPEISENFDLILGADILYSPHDFPNMIRSLDEMLAPGGKWVIAEPGRPQANDFFARVIQMGMQVQTTHHAVALHGEKFEIGVSEIS